jgi:hypothetical protein
MDGLETEGFLWGLKDHETPVVGHNNVWRVEVDYIKVLLYRRLQIR